VDTTYVEVNYFNIFFSKHNINKQPNSINPVSIDINLKQSYE